MGFTALETKVAMMALCWQLDSLGTSCSLVKNHRRVCIYLSVLALQIDLSFIPL